ncbi:PorT family protein [Chitinophaga oryzae]|uniref:PorT family protein n=1 Tax=Chitinophaga oryzae TaxID=2725414 RepID=A0AAE7D9C5_9BACT|nr:porin family protein [Chitinophaga oryzae]QJB33093.1 PorT family protein [Chitinophaga oryzae]QJB39567.1 PorT family protein [Chitinophaga oryzae]
MKKLRLAVAVIAAAALCPFMAKAQIDLGAKAGLSIPNLTSGSSSNPINSGWSSRLGLDAGIHAEFHLTKRFSIQPEIRYSSQGGKKDGNQGFAPTPEMAGAFQQMGQPVPPYLYATYKSEAKFNYLMVPVLAKYHFGFSPKWDLYVAAGPFVSFLLNGKNETSGTSQIFADDAHKQPLPFPAVDFTRDQDIKNDLKKANFGISGHVGLAYHLNGRSAIFIEGGGNYGFVKIQKDAKNGENNTGAGVVVLGYSYRIKNK